MSHLERIVEDLRTLPPGKLDQAADYIQRLKRISQEQRQIVLARIAGSLSQKEADRLDKAIEDGCENVDERDW